MKLEDCELACSIDLTAETVAQYKLQLESVMKVLQEDVVSDGGSGTRRTVRHDGYQSLLERHRKRYMELKKQLQVEARERLMASSSAVTMRSGAVLERLERMKASLIAELEKANMGYGELQTSTRTMGEATEENRVFDKELRGSGGVLRSLKRRARTDSVLIFIGLMVFAASILHVLRGRLPLFPF
jgi:uncharacterized protein (DUF342 family)